MDVLSTHIPPEHPKGVQEEYGRRRITPCSNTCGGRSSILYMGGKNSLDLTTNACNSPVVSARTYCLYISSSFSSPNNTLLKYIIEIHLEIRKNKLFFFGLVQCNIITNFFFGFEPIDIVHLHYCSAFYICIFCKTTYKIHVNTPYITT